MKHFPIISVSLLAALIAFVLFGNKTFAAVPITGVTISPAIQQIMLNPNQTTDNFSDTVTNNTNSVINVTIKADDFTTLGQNNQISFYTNSSHEDGNKHGLVSFIKISDKQIIIEPHQSLEVPISIINANRLSVGGHYAAIMYKVNGYSSPNKNIVQVNQVVSSLIFLSTNGEGTQTTTLATPIVSSLQTSFPSIVNLVFADNGNTQTTVSGLVQILDSSSKVVSQAQINVGSGLILPGTKRLFSINLNKTAGHLWPGIYKLKVTYNHIGQSKYMVYEQNFLYINIYILWTVVAIICIIALLLNIKSKNKNKNKNVKKAFRSKK